MTSVEIYLELLRAGLWNRPAVVSGSARITEIVELASKQNTLPIVYKAILEGTSVMLQPKTLENMNKVLQRCESSHHAANTVIAYVFSELGKAEITPVLLKGQGIASWYPVNNIRTPGDIDLYVREFDDSRMILEQLFGPVTEEGTKHVTFHIGGTLDLELHRFTEILPDKKANEYYQSISDEGTSNNLSAVSLDGSMVYTPEDTFNAFYIFHHLWNHVKSMGMGMRQLCDWSMLLNSHQGKLDLPRLEGYLRNMNLMDVWQVFGCAAVQALDLSSEVVPFYDESKAKRGAKLVDFFLAQGDNLDFKHGRGGQSALKHKTGSLQFIHRRLRMMFPIFPGKALLQYVRDVKNGLLKLVKAGAADLGGE